MYIMWYNTKQLCKNAKNRRGDFMLNIYKTDLETNDFKKDKLIENIENETNNDKNKKRQ